MKLLVEYKPTVHDWDRAIEPLDCAMHINESSPCPLRLGHATRFRLLSEVLIKLSRLHTFNQRKLMTAETEI